MFNVKATAEGMEFRGLEHKTSKAGKAFVAARFEDEGGYSVEVSCRDSELFPALDALQKGDICTLPVRCISTKDYSLVALVAAPGVTANAYV